MAAAAGRGIFWQTRDAFGAAVAIMGVAHKDHAIAAIVVWNQISSLRSDRSKPLP
jgi:hypothetical protein